MRGAGDGINGYAQKDGPLPSFSASIILHVIERKRFGILALALAAVAAGLVGYGIGSRIHKLPASRPRVISRVAVVTVSRPEAVRIARRDANDWSAKPLGIVSARLGRVDHLVGGDPGVPAARLVWAVVLSGSFPPASCGGFRFTPGTETCPPSADTATEIIDATTGQVIQVGTP